MTTWIQIAFKPFKALLPRPVWGVIRTTCTAFLTPAYFSWRSGHFKSSFKKRAVSRSNKPLPWYSYPSIDFLRGRSYADKDVLEFGAGQSTLWWAERARSVLSFEGNLEWYGELKTKIPSNVELQLVAVETLTACSDDVRRILSARQESKFDIVVIDGF